jgi:hypothetical protein
MPCSLSQAHREVLAILATALPGSLPVAWPDVAKQPGFPPAAGSWIRVSITDNDEDSPPTLVSSPGNRRYKTQGLLTVSIFALAGDGRRAAQVLGETVLAAYRGQSTVGGVTFRNERVNDIGPDGPWYHINAIVGFSYSTLQ